MQQNMKLMFGSDGTEVFRESWLPTVACSGVLQCIGPSSHQLLGTLQRMHGEEFTKERIYFTVSTGTLLEAFGTEGDC